jgi:single-stranded-DNA-specific exonuclease
MSRNVHRVTHKSWQFVQADEPLIDEVAAAFDIHPIIARIIVNRGFRSHDEIDRFLHGRLSDLYDPFLLGDMGCAVERVLDAVARREHIMVYGDYDVDGMTSVALLSGLFTTMRASHSYYLPNRITEGYGISTDGIERCREANVAAGSGHAGLIITVDCGITSHNELAYAKRLGMDVIVTDHHEPGATLPDCLAAINPKRSDCTYPFKDLAGVGVTFKLVHDLTNRAVERGMLERAEVNLKQKLDLVALGTIADTVTLLDENRILVKHGLRQLSRSERIGLQELKAVSNVNEEITSYDVAYRLAPRLNAVGRLGDARSGVELLCSEDEKEAFNLATLIEQNNRRRQTIEQEILREVEEVVDRTVDLDAVRTIVLASDRWHLGVVPIVASRIAKTYHRPTAIISVDGRIGKGSARSVGDIALLDTLRECEDLLESYGGHRLAAGFQIRPDNIEAFRARFEEATRRRYPGTEPFMPSLSVEVETDLSEVTLDFVHQLQTLEPFGHGNPQPVFASRGVYLKWSPKLVGSNHLKLWFESKDSVVEGIGFAMGELLPQLRNSEAAYDIAYIPRLNYFRGEETVQLLIRDVKFASKD